LHDTRLESAHVLVNGLPVDGIPFRRFAGDLTNSFSCRHLLCRISRFIKFSRVQHLGEVCPLSRSVMWSVERTQPISAPLQSSICFLSNLLPAPPSILLTVDLSSVLPVSDTGLSCSV